jgi:hypothetical protein
MSPYILKTVFKVKHANIENIISKKSQEYFVCSTECNRSLEVPVMIVWKCNRRNSAV